MADWMGRDESMIGYINDLLAGQRTNSLSFSSEGEGGESPIPIFGSYSERRSRTPPADWEREPQPTRQGGIGTYANIGPARGVLSATGESRPDGSTSIYPNVGLQAGPLNVRGGLAVEPGQPVRPNFGFGAGIPFGNRGSVEGDVSIVPGQSQTFGLQGAYDLSPQERIAALLGLTRFDDGRAPDARAGLSYQYKFPTPRRVFEPETEIKPGSGRYR